MSRHSRNELSLKLLIAFAMMLIAGLTNSFACSIQVDENAQKNILIAHAVSYSDVSLSAASGIALSDFDRNFEGGATASSCPDYMTISARVSFTHVKSPFESCSYGVTVSVRSYMGEEYPDGPIEEITFSEGEAACSLRNIRLPKKIILNKKRIVKYPFPR